MVTFPEIDFYKSKEWTVEEQSSNAVKWIEKLKSTSCKQQASFLGGKSYGYNIFGLGCRLLDIPFYPDEQYSNHFHKAVGLYDKKGTCQRAVFFNNKMYGNLESLNHIATFARISKILRTAHNTRLIFKPEVAELIIYHYNPTKVKNIK